MLVRQREQGPIIQRIGDIFLGAAAEFRMVYPVYVGNLPVAEKRVKEEAENNAEFRRFLEVRTVLRKIFVLISCSKALVTMPAVLI
jgi:hypothetical protein